MPFSDSLVLVLPLTARRRLAPSATLGLGSFQAVFA
jgi:hypothetical protein